MHMELTLTFLQQYHDNIDEIQTVVFNEESDGVLKQSKVLYFLVRGEKVKFVCYRNTAGMLKIYSAPCKMFNSKIVSLEIRLNSVENIPIMYGHSGFNGFFGSSLQGIGPIPMHSGIGIMNNPRVNRNFFIDNGSFNMHCPLRKVLCGELRLQDAGFPVEICGRIQNQRLGRFLSLRDDTGITQLVVPDDRIDIQKRLRNMPLNSFLVLRGFVTARPDKSRNEKMPTGDVEVLIENLVSVHPKRKKDDSESDEESLKRSKKKASVNTASLKLTSEELSKCPTPTLINYFSQRSHTCGELSKRLVGKSITLCGWVSAKRVGRFVMLKDGYGSIQIVPEIQNIALINKFQNLHINSILVVKGIVSCRPPGHENPRMENGNIEILVESLTVVNPNDPISPGGVNKEGENGDSSGKNSDSVMISEKEIKEKQEVIVPNPNKYCYRTHTCGELNESNVGQKVRLMGWIEFTRMDKFILLRDRYGRTQLIIPDSRSDLQDLMQKLPLESIISAEGTVCSRPPGQENPKQETGFIEISVMNLKVLSTAKSDLPFCVRDFLKPMEPVRLKYRYLDLRHDSMQHNLRLRSNTVHKMRRYLIEHLDFTEIETPTLFRRTPGGAQEFIVPTRTQGKFYSLVQSPQQFKQLLMVGSVDRYFQFAHCYRDESLGSDRQPEFSQLDIELSFCERENILNLIEDLLKYSWPENVTSLTFPFQRLTYEEAMNSYGTDKPDLRFGWKIEALTEVFTEHKSSCEGKIDVKNFLDEKNFAVHAFVGRQGCSKFSNSTKRNILEQIQKYYPSTNFYIFPVQSLRSTKEILESLFCKVIAEEIEKTIDYKKDDVIFMAIGPKPEVLESLGKIRINFANYLEEKNVKVIQKNAFKFLWVLDFPLFLKVEDKIESCHHPFTQPHPDDFHLLENEPLKVRSLHYDLVLNGQEIGGGSIRIHDAEVQRLILEKILKIELEPLSHLLDALSCGAPPHGGIALGFDRLIAIVCGVQTIRDVIAFPKSTSGQDCMSGAPSDILDEEKELYHIKKNS